MQTNSEKMQHSDWLKTARSLNIESRLFINGSYVEAKSGARFESVNPATGEVLAAVARGGVADIDLAVVSAKEAWRDGRWRFMAPRDRMNVLFRLADLIEARSEELALLDTLDMGKPITDSLTIDLPEVIVTFRYFAECIDKLEGVVTNSDSNTLHMILKEPLGVVGAISPWNYPRRA